mmetsp:Transcript_15937/g.44092  ORF Transcript_15937/g.44092 Transcript_15937/m.44092 type:complete len:267 (+) Transcript_15937:497-1297(+)
MAEPLTDHPIAPKQYSTPSFVCSLFPSLPFLSEFDRLRGSLPKRRPQCPFHRPPPGGIAVQQMGQEGQATTGQRVLEAVPQRQRLVRLAAASGMRRRAIVQVRREGTEGGHELGDLVHFGGSVQQGVTPQQLGNHAPGGPQINGEGIVVEFLAVVMVAGPKRRKEKLGSPVPQRDHVGRHPADIGSVAVVVVVVVVVIFLVTAIAIAIVVILVVDDPGPRAPTPPSSSDGPGQAEIAQLEALGGPVVEQVARLDIPVQNPVVVAAL